MAKMARFNSLVADFADNFDFLTVYVKEAHPTDGWKIEGNRFQIAQHKMIEDRLNAAKDLRTAGVKCEIVVDTMANEATQRYKAFPESLYVIQNGQVQYQALGPYAYDPDELKTWMTQKNKEISHPL